MLILEDLYVGEVRPGERHGKRNQQYTKALDEVIKAGDALTSSLTEQQKELFGFGVEFCVSDIRQSQEWRCRNRAEYG